MRRIRTAIIGLGRIGSLLEEDGGRMHPCTHAGALFHFSRRIRVVAAADTEEERRTLFCQRWKYRGEMYESGEQLLMREKPELLVICSSTGTHAKLAEQAVKKGVKGIILEKPVAGSLAKAEKILHLSGEKGCRIIVCHDRRFSSGFRKMKNLMKKELGPLLSLRSELHASLCRSSSNPLLHDGTHIMDIASFLAGKAVSYDFRASRKVKDCQNPVRGFVFFKGGIVLDYIHEPRSSFYECLVEATGEKGKIIISNTGIKAYSSGKGSPYLRLKQLDLQCNNPYLERTRIMIELLNGSRKRTVSGIREGVEAIRMCECAWRSACAGKVVGAGG